MRMRASQQIIERLIEAADCPVDDVLREALTFIDMSGQLEDVDWALVHGQDVARFGEALYGVISKFEDYLGETAVE